MGLYITEMLDSADNAKETADAMWDRIPMVRVNGRLYYDTGRESRETGRCGTMDGEITSTVDGTEIPMEDNQSNFGSGFGYQYGKDDTIEIYMMKNGLYSNIGKTISKKAVCNTNNLINNVYIRDIL